MANIKKAIADVGSGNPVAYATGKVDILITTVVAFNLMLKSGKYFLFFLISAQKWPP